MDRLGCWLTIVVPLLAACPLETGRIPLPVDGGGDGVIDGGADADTDAGDAGDVGDAGDAHDAGDAGDAGDSCPPESACCDGGDGDGDGQNRPACGGLDCDDGNPSVFVGAPDQLDADLTDTNCDGGRTLPGGDLQ